MAIKLDPIVLDRDVATELAKEYAPISDQSKALVARDSSTNVRALAAIDTGLHETYVALGEGKKVIDIRQAFTDAGQDANLRPNIAIARADWRGVGLTRFQNGALRFTDPTVPAEKPSPYIVSAPPKVFDIPPVLPVMKNHDFVAGAMVPTIPPKIRPDNLIGFVLLWEVNDWKGVPRPVPSRLSVFRESFAEKSSAFANSLASFDPILLRPLGGPLYVVVAAWDLSPIEALIIGAL